MRKMTFLAIIGALGLLLNGCKKEAQAASAAETAAPAPFDLAAAKTAIEEGYREFEKAYDAKDAAALANCYATDGKFMNPNAKAVEGKANIRDTFTGWFKGDTTKIKLSLVELWGNETNVIAENSWTISDKDGKVLDEGKSIEVYKMEDGKWRMLRDCYNSNLPAPPPPPAPAK
jgi:uncharacterized protein (TIGR02246 family)